MCQSPCLNGSNNNNIETYNNVCVYVPSASNDPFYKKKKEKKRY